MAHNFECVGICESAHTSMYVLGWVGIRLQVLYVCVRVRGWVCQRERESERDVYIPIHLSDVIVRISAVSTTTLLMGYKVVGGSPLSMLQ